MSDTKYKSIILGKGIIEPDEDIDIMKEIDHLRIERTSEEGFWFAGYTDETSEYEYNFWVLVDEGRVSIKYEITTRVPIHIFPDNWGETVDEEVVCSICDWVGNNYKELVSHYSLSHENTYADIVEEEIGVEPKSLNIHSQLNKIN